MISWHRIQRIFLYLLSPRFGIAETVTLHLIKYQRSTSYYSSFFIKGFLIFRNFTPHSLLCSIWIVMVGKYGACNKSPLWRDLLMTRDVAVKIGSWKTGRSLRIFGKWKEGKNTLVKTMILVFECVTPILCVRHIIFIVPVSSPHPFTCFNTHILVLPACWDKCQFSCWLLLHR